MPEQFKESEKQDLEYEEYSKIDLEVEEKLKNQLQESEEIPEWDDPHSNDSSFENPVPVIVDIEEEPVIENPKDIAIAVADEAVKIITPPVIATYDKILLDYHLAVGNPFARTLISFGILDENNRYFCPLESKPYEKIWFYKDEENKVQGPFSTIMMFNWTINGFFPPDLEIGIGNTDFFVPMDLFNSLPPMPDPAYYQRPRNNQNRGHHRNKTLDEIEKKFDRKGDERNRRYNNNSAKPKDDAATQNLKDLLGLGNISNTTNNRKRSESVV